MTFVAPLSLDDFKRPASGVTASQLVFMNGCGSASLFYGRGDDEPPRLISNPQNPLDDVALLVTVGNENDAHVAMVYLGEHCICQVLSERLGWKYVFPHGSEFTGNTALLTAQISALVHEAIEAKAHYNPINYAGTVPLGVQ